MRRNEYKRVGFLEDSLALEQPRTLHLCTASSVHLVSSDEFWLVSDKIDLFHLHQEVGLEEDAIKCYR
jgi:hypothetical protein